MTGIFEFMELMGTSDIALLAAFFIGLMMSLSPCPLATNITAMAYISKNISAKKSTILLIGSAYTLGRAVTYVAIAAFIVFIGLNVQAISLPLQTYGEKLLGPLLILIGVVLSGLVKIPLSLGIPGLEPIKEKLAHKGLLGSFILGVIFALAFCPFSAVLFFGMLIPLALKNGDALIIPLVFSVGTALPVVAFSFLLACGVSKLGGIMGGVQAIERYMRIAVSAVFLLVGLYYTLALTFGLI